MSTDIWKAPANLTMFEIHTTWQQLLRGEGAQVYRQFDLSAVEEIDSSGAQLLLYLVQLNGIDEPKPTVVAMSEPARHVIRSLGLLDNFSYTEPNHG